MLTGVAEHTLRMLRGTNMAETEKLFRNQYIAQ